MSFILDALNKSDEKRRSQQAGARRKTLFHTSRPSRGQRFSQRSLLVLLLVCFLFGLGVWLWPREETASVNSQIASVPTDSVEEQAGGGSAEPRIPVPRRPEPVSEVTTPVTKPQPSPVTRPVKAVKPVRPATKPASQVRQAVAQREVPPPVKASVPDAEAVTAYADLPVEVRSQLPALDLTLHYYSPESGKSMIRLNGHLLHPGDRVDGDLIVQEITPDGTRFAYRGVVFNLLRPGRDTE